MPRPKKEISVKIDVSDMREKVSKVNSKIEKIAQDALVSSAISILVPKIRAKIRENGSDFKGDLAESIEVKKGPSGEVIVGSFGLEYAAWVERGSRARKIRPHETKQLEEYVRKKEGLSGANLGRVVSAIKRTIRQKGNFPHPYLLPTFEENKEQVIQTAVTRIRATLERAM